MALAAAAILAGSLAVEPPPRRPLQRSRNIGSSYTKKGPGRKHRHGAGRKRR